MKRWLGDILDSERGDGLAYVVLMFQDGLALLASGVLPLILVALGAGLVLGLFQSASRIMDPMISVVPRFLVVVVALAYFGPLLIRRLAELLETILTADTWFGPS